jgi:putative chitinase
MINRDFFFESTNLRLFEGRMKTSQRDGLSGIVEEWDARHAHDDDRWLAYMLGTVHHETDKTFRPIKEYGGNAWYMKNYDITGDNPRRARANGNTEKGDGIKYCGKGFVQLTWKNNYAAMSPALGFELAEAPDRAMELPVATKILFYGMIKGTFTGRKLGDYFNPQGADWVGARRIINGRDKANLVADYAKRYYGAISYTTG